MMTSRGRGPAGWAEKIVKDAAIGLMLPEHRALFALAFPPRRDRVARVGAKALFGLMEARAPVARAVPLLRRQVDTAAFGARRAH